jgi:hypothetical protein
MYRVIVVLCLLALCSTVLVRPALAQGGPPLGFVRKLGQEIDVRSGGRILEDDLSSSNIILPDLAGPVAGGPKRHYSQRVRVHSLGRHAEPDH